MFKRTLLATALAASLAALPGAAEAACAIKNTVPIKTLSASFDAWKAVTSAWAECGNVQSEMDMNFRTKQPTAFAANPSLYHIGGVANNTVVPLLNAGTVRPLDEYIAKYGQGLSANQLIKVDLLLNSVTFSLTGIAAFTSLFGMNLGNSVWLGDPSSYWAFLVVRHAARLQRRLCLLP